MNLLIEEDNVTGDYLEADVYEGLGMVLVIKNPWSGDTETGFGREGSITLTREKASALAQFLIDFVESA